MIMEVPLLSVVGGEAGLPSRVRKTLEALELPRLPPVPDKTKQHTKHHLSIVAIKVGDTVTASSLTRLR